MAPGLGKTLCLGLGLGAALLAAGSFAACGPRAEPAIAQPQTTLSPSPSPGPTLGPGATPLDRLCACDWVDVYDSAFILTFDKMGKRMTERNDPAGVHHSSRISVEAAVILIYDDLGLLLSSLPYTLTEDSLAIDYGEALGILEYRALR